METITQSEIIHPASVINDLELTATLPHEMVTAQEQLIGWCDKKIEVIRKECNELNEATEHAKKMKWKSSALYNQYLSSLKRLSYYDKVKTALVEGYYIVPNFPIQMFAIRTTKKNVSGYSHSYWSDFVQNAQELKKEEGDYKNPFPIIKRKSAVFNRELQKETSSAESYATDWDDFEFPVTMAKPSIMQATSRAMALKIFDQIGIMPAHKKEDPVIIGQIINRKGYTTKIVSFMIAWHLNTNVI